MPTTDTDASREAAWVEIHPLVVRITHWINAFAILIMVTSGLRIHNAEPILPFKFANEITLGAGLAGAIQWHFAAMWLLAANGLIYLGYGFVSGHFRRKLWPVRPTQVIANVLATIFPPTTPRNAPPTLLSLFPLWCWCSRVWPSGNRCSSRNSPRSSAGSIPRESCILSPWRCWSRWCWCISLWFCWCRKLFPP